MSYVIAILTPPVPPDDAEAWKLWESRMDEDYGGSGTSEVMRRLHDLLVARFPCITIDPSSVWTDGPLINNFGKVQAALGLVEVDEAIGFVVETANSLGLTVFDDQAGKIYRPGDKSPESEIGKHGFTDLTKKEALDVIFDGLKEIGLGEGFKLRKKDRVFYRKVNGGLQCVGVPFSNYSPIKYTFSLYFLIELDIVSEVFKKLLDALQVPEKDRYVPTFLIGLEKFIEGRGRNIDFELVTKANMDRHIEYLKPVFEEGILPFLERTVNPASLLYFIDDIYAAQHFLEYLIVAWLSNKSEFETEVNQVRRRITGEGEGSMAYQKAMSKNQLEWFKEQSRMKLDKLNILIKILETDHPQ